ncbi:MAG: hypothetical protein GF317_13800 [Candidatus Lokiarchaeota archaeon]|nr:hypothetical protein [Candidatus Lokiarchaeota archaeon]MBD3200701.1 hypothetical protein [Candidatus Lokiarchaeota archaeon]
MINDKIREKIEEYLKSKPNTYSLSIYSIDNKEIYISPNWQGDNFIEKISAAWTSSQVIKTKISNLKFVILQKTPEILILVNPKEKEYILGYKDEERQIFTRFSEKISSTTKVSPDKNYELTVMTRILNNLSSKKPYISDEQQLGKASQIKWTSPKLLLNRTENLKKLGLLKVGLSYEEAKVYLHLLSKGERGDKVGNLNKELDIKRTTIYRIIDRLIDYNWVEKVSETPRGVNFYAAKPFNLQFDEIIREKEKELQVLKSMRYIMNEGTQDGVIKFSELDAKNQTIGEESYSYQTLGLVGIENDCGVIIFDYDKNIDEDIVLKAALQLSNEKMLLEINKQGNSDIDDIKIIDKKFHKYRGAVLFLKFKEKSDIGRNLGYEWISIVNQVAIPIKNKIYVLWGTEEKFPVLLSLILNIN